MLVAMEARRLQDEPLGGVGRGLAQIAPQLATRVPLTVLEDRRLPMRPVAGATVETLGPPLGAPGSVWLQTAVRAWARRSLREPGSVFHGTFNALPVGLPCPSVVSIYDLSFELHPEDFGPARRRAFQLQARAAARTAARIVTTSAFSAEQIVTTYRVPPDRVVVTPWSFDPIFTPERADGAAAVTAALGVRGPYVVAVGGARRRGAEVAVAAWRAVRARGAAVELVVVGALDAAPEPGLHQLTALDDATWATVLAGAEALLYPTRYEGFGLPALEAAASGTPVVCAPVGPLPEVLGAAAQWCDAPTAPAIVDGLEQVLTDPDRATELRTAGLARAAATSWDHVAGQLEEVYREVTGG